jgi:alpha-ketoglutarate-dependent taurine dioxygenase
MCNHLFKKFLVNADSQDFFANLTLQLQQVGLATVEGIDSAEKMVKIAESLGNILVQEDTDDRGVKIQHWSESGEGSFFHTDRASIPNPPNVVFVVCNKQALEGGNSIFVDGKELYQSLKKDRPEVLAKFFQLKTAMYGLTPPHISAGSIFNKSEDGGIFLKFRFDGRGGYFSSSILYDVPILIDYIHKLSFSFRLKENQGYFVQNGRWLHGSKAFFGERMISRIILHSKIRAPGGEDIGFGFEEE